MRGRNLLSGVAIKAWVGFCMCVHHENHYTGHTLLPELLSLLAGLAHLCTAEEGLVIQLLYKAVIHHMFIQVLAI